MDTIIMTRGDSRVVDLHVVDKEGADVDLTSVTLWFTAKLSLEVADSSAIIRKTTGGGGIAITDAAHGVGTITFAPADTISIEGKQGLTLFWDLQSKTVAGLVTTLDSGTMVIKAGVTRDYV